MQAQVVGKRRGIGLGLLLVGLVPFTVGCEGDEGPQGEPGPPGDPASGEEPTDLSPEEDPPGIVVEILSVDGASGGGASWQVGDVLSVTFTVKKDDGEDWESLTEFSSARALLSGPTFNYNRVLPEVSDLAAASVHNPDGSWTYTFADPIPAVYEPPLNDTPSFGPLDGELSGQALLAGTYTLGVYFRWNYTVEGEDFRDQGETTQDLLFLGATTLAHRELVLQENCNRCHVDLQAHGTNRKGVGLCLLCHTSGAEDRNTVAAGGTPGVSIDFRVMIHKIHNGGHLPSVLGVGTNPDGSRNYAETPQPYQLVGFNDSIADFSDVGFPAWPNLSSPMPRDEGFSALGTTQQGLEDTIRMGVTGCAICHGDPDGDGPLVEPSQGAVAFSQPSRRACGACHDDVDFTGPYTSNGSTMPAQNDDSACVLCHSASGDALAISDAHLHPLLNPNVNPGLVVALTGAAEAGAHDGDGTFDPGEKVQVTFDLFDDAGLPVAGSSLTSMSAVISGPASNQNLLLSASFPPAALAGSGPYTVNVPEQVLLEYAGDATGGADLLATAKSPHWNVTGATTTVFLRTAISGGASSLLEAAGARQNYLDLADASGFLRDDYVVIDDGLPGLEEYLRIQFVEGDRIWFSSTASTSTYAPGTRVAHAAGAAVNEVTLTTLTAGVDYSLDAAAGEITELIEFGAGNAVVVSYTSDFVVPDTYPIPLNDSPDLGDEWGEWRGKSLVAGTYQIGLWGYRDQTLALFGESQSYRGPAPLGKAEILVGDAAELEPYGLISSAESCYACHQDIYFHGNGRRGVDTCLICHTTAGSEDRPQYVAAAAPATTGVQIGFREMLHKIHRGEELAHASTYTVVGFGSGYPNNFSEHTYEHVVFPALPSGVKDCAACHGDGNESWHAPGNREHPTEQLEPVLEWRMVCGACHDDDGAQAHMGTQTDPVTGQEACTVCHSSGDELDVELVHKVR